MDLYVLLLSIFIFGFFFRSLLRRSPAKTLPPGPAGLPIIGSLHLLGERTNQSLAKLAKVHGLLFTLRLGSITTVVASSAEVAKKILQKHEQTFSNRPMPGTVSSQPNPEATLAWSPGDHRWRNRRRVCNRQMYNRQKLDQLQHLRHKKAQELVHLSKKHALSARKEIIETIPSHQLVHESDIDRLPYLQAIVKETLRLHPAAPLLLWYIVTDDVELLGFVVPKNTQLLVNARAIERDPKHWDQPFLFLPERFLNSGVDYKGRNFEYIPFGAGRTICTGMPLAVRMVHLILASVLQAFDWKLPEGTTPENMDMEEQFGITLKKAVPLRAIPGLESLV